MVVLQLVLSFTRWGIYTVAVGSNRLAAAEAGIRVRLVIIRNFILCALLRGLVGVLEAVRTTSVQPDPSGANDVLFGGIRRRSSAARCWPAAPAPWSAR